MDALSNDWFFLPFDTILVGIFFWLDNSCFSDDERKQEWKIQVGGWKMKEKNKITIISRKLQGNWIVWI